MATYKPSQDILVSGTNIKTVNTNSLLGSGNVDISGGASYPNFIDQPPASPSAWDDEFDNGSIAAAWEDYNLASGTKSEDADTKSLIIGGAGSGISQQGLVRTSPTGGFTITCKLGGGATTNVSWRYGIVVAESKTGKAFVYSLLSTGAALGNSLYELMNSPTSRASYNNVVGTINTYGVGYLKVGIYNDAGTWRANVLSSTTGTRWYQVNPGSIAIGFTPAYIGLVVNSEGVAGVNTGYFDWFRVVEG